MEVERERKISGIPAEDLIRIEYLYQTHNTTNKNKIVNLPSLKMQAHILVMLQLHLQQSQGRQADLQPLWWTLDL